MNYPEAALHYFRRADWEGDESAVDPGLDSSESINDAA
jgi:hypothetical protein